MARQAPPSISGGSIHSANMEASFVVDRASQGGLPVPLPPNPATPLTIDLAQASGTDPHVATEPVMSGHSMMPDDSFVAVFAPLHEMQVRPDERSSIHSYIELRSAPYSVPIVYPFSWRIDPPQDDVEEPSNYGLAHLFPGGRPQGARRLSFAPFLLRLARSIGRDAGVPGALKWVEAALTVQRSGASMVVACAQLGNWVVSLGLPERLCGLRQVGGLCAMVADMCFYCNGPTVGWRDESVGAGPGAAPRLKAAVQDSIDRICGRVFGQLLFRLPLVPGCLASAAFEGAVPHLPISPPVRLELFAGLAQAEVLLPPLEEALSGAVHTAAFRECCLLHGGRVVASNLTAELTDAAWTVCLSEGFFLREPSHAPLMHVQDLHVHTSASRTKSGRGLPEDPPAPLHMAAGARRLASDPSASTVQVILVVAGVSTTLACMVLYPEEGATSDAMDLSWELDVLLATARDARQHLVESWFDRSVLALEATAQEQPPQVLDLILGRPHPWNVDTGPDPLVPFAFYEENYEQVKANIAMARMQRGEQNARAPPRGRSPGNSPPVSPPRSPRSRSGSPLNGPKPVLRYPALARVDAYLFHDPTSGALYGSGPAFDERGASMISPRKSAQAKRSLLEEVQLLYRMMPDLRKRFLMTEARAGGEGGDPGSAAGAPAARAAPAVDPSARDSVSLTLDQLMERVRSSVATLEGPSKRPAARATDASAPSARPAPDCLPRHALLRVAPRDRLRQEEARFLGKEGKVLKKSALSAKPMKEDDVFPAMEDAAPQWVSAHFDPATGREAYALHSWVDEPDFFKDVFQELVMLHC